MRLAGQPALPGILNIRRPNGTATRRRLRFTELIAGVPKAMCEPAALASLLRKSDSLAALDVVAQSWFEDGPQVAQAVERARIQGALCREVRRSDLRAALFPEEDAEADQPAAKRPFKKSN